MRPRPSSAPNSPASHLMTYVTHCAPVWRNWKASSPLRSARSKFLKRWTTRSARGRCPAFRAARRSKAGADARLPQALASRALVDRTIASLTEIEVHMRRGREATAVMPSGRRAKAAPYARRVRKVIYARCA